MIDLATIDTWFLIKIFGTVIGIFIFEKIFSIFLRKLFDKTSFPENIENMIIRLSKYLVWIIGFFIILGIVGVDLTSMVVGMGAFSIAISFATKDIVQNLISGIVVFTDRPFRVGDIIEVKKHKGKVKKIGIRTTTIVEESGNLITIPNTMLVINPIKKFK